MTLHDKFHNAKNSNSDINEHIQTLADYAQNCKHVTELGIRWINSTWGFLYGLSKSPLENKKLIGVDISNIDTSEVKTLAEKENIDYTFIQADSATVELEQTDILFIDTWHIYGHLKRELNKHHKKVHNYIILHDTVTFGEQGERTNYTWDNASPYTQEELSKGLNPAIKEFINEYPEWKIHAEYKNNNGLTILSKQGE